MADAYLLDTCMIPQLFDDRPEDELGDAASRFRRRLAAAQDCPLFICAITVGEVEYGLRAAKLPDVHKQRRVRAALKAFDPVLTVTADTASPHWAQMRADLFGRYAPHHKREKARTQILIDELLDPVAQNVLGIQENDLWIASVALQYNLVLVTDDKLARIRTVCPALRVENWLEEPSN